MTFEYPPGAGNNSHNVGWEGTPPPCDGNIPGGDTNGGRAWKGTCSFDAPGTYRFECKVHAPLMKGTVVVVAPEPSPVETASATPTPTGTAPPSGGGGDAGRRHPGHAAGHPPADHVQLAADGQGRLPPEGDQRPRDGHDRRGPRAGSRSRSRSPPSASAATSRPPPRPAHAPSPSPSTPAPARRSAPSQPEAARHRRRGSAATHVQRAIARIASMPCAVVILIAAGLALSACGEAPAPARAPREAQARAARRRRDGPHRQRGGARDGHARRRRGPGRGRERAGRRRPVRGQESRSPRATT